MSSSFIRSTIWFQKISLTKLTDYIIENMDKGALTGMLLIDLRKAFDLVDLELMLHKINIYGCNTVSMAGFKSYLHNCKQFVSYDGHLSQFAHVKLGVPQGSILEQLMFILFMNDIVLEVKDSEFEIYANYSTMCKNAPTVNEINNQLTELSKPIYNCIDVNHMVLNIPKTESMLMETVQRLRNAIDSFSIGEDEFIISIVNTHKLLGLHVDNSFTWDRYVASLVSKVRRRLHVLNKIKHILRYQSRIDFYNGLIQPIIDYGRVVWGNCRKELLYRVYKAMKMCARSIYDVYDYRVVSSVSLFERLDWLPIDLCITYFEGIQVYNILYGSCPEYLKGFIKLVDHGRNTRNSNNTNILKVPKTNLKLGEISFKFRASALWNGLNINIKNADNIDVFKQKLTKDLKCDIYTCDKFCLDLPRYYNE